MFIKLTKSGPRRYVQLVEAYRDSDGRPKHRTVAALGRLDQPGSGLEAVISGLLRVTGNETPAIKHAKAATKVPEVKFDPTRSYGDVWALTELCRTYAKPGQRATVPAALRCLAVQAYCLRQRALLGQFCVSPIMAFTWLWRLGQNFQAHQTRNRCPGAGSVDGD